jgi:tetratricopeptide (TPR) repeat protein
LRGIEFFKLGNPGKEGSENARQMFQKAIELDPKYSDAYAWLGNVLVMAQVNQWSYDPRGFDRAIQLGQQSIALDNSNAFAYAMMSFSYTSIRQYDLGITAAERALAFDPNLAEGYNSLALALSSSGKPAEGVKAAHEAMRLDPSNRDFYSGIEGRAYVLMGKYEEAIPPLKMALAGC